MNLPFDWRDMLRFDKMIAPTFLTILYYIHTVVCIVASSWFILKGMDAYYGGGLMVMSGLAGLVLGPFIIRLFYELLIVIFKIHTRLSSIDRTLLHTQPDLVSNDSRPGLSPASTSTVGPAPAISFATAYPAAELTGLAQPVSTPVTDPIQPPLPIEFQEPASTPLSESAMPDFWTTSGATHPTGNKHPTATSVLPIHLNNLRQKVPNWPAVLASTIVLYAIVSPYAVIGYDSSASLGQLAGLTYVIKNSSLGIIAVFAALTMIITSAGGLKWLWFTVAYGFTAIGAAFAFLDESSVFSQLSKAKETMNGVSSTLDSLVPGADQFTHNIVGNVPSASEYLTVTFYLFVLTMLFLGYWALVGKYEEQGIFVTSND